MEGKDGGRREGGRQGGSIASWIMWDLCGVCMWDLYGSWREGGGRRVGLYVMVFGAFMGRAGRLLGGGGLTSDGLFIMFLD